MKQITFNVTLTFSEKIQGDEEIKEVANKIVDSLIFTANSSGLGLSPDNTEIETESIKVYEPFSETVIEAKNTL